MPEQDINTGTQTGAAGLAFGLDGVIDFSPQLPFLDIFKSARPWTGHLEGQWGGMTAADLRAAGVLDADGWPTEIPQGVTHIETFVLTELPQEASYTEGSYRLTFDGTGDIHVFGATDLRQDGDEIWFDYTPTGSSVVAISIHETDPLNTGDHIRNISLVHEDHVAAHDNGALFNPLWIDKIEDVHSLRFMDWMQTNENTSVTWADAPRVLDYTYAEGVPVEVMVQLANETLTEPWFNMPFGADADYIETFATYVRDNLDQDLRAHYEFSNEVWNFLFDQARDSAAEGVARFGADLPDGWMQNYGAAASEMATVLDQVYAGHEDALVKVIATHTAWPGLEESALHATAWQDMGHPPPYTLFDTYAVTGYFDGALGREKADTVRDWLIQSRAAAETEATNMGLSGGAFDAHVEAHAYDLATDLAVQELRDGSVTGNPDGSIAELSQLFDYHAQVAEDHGLSLVMYEGGTHVVGIGANVSDAELSDFFQHLNYSPGMGDLYDELLTAWDDAGGTLFNAFVDVARPSQFGSWGSLRHLEDTTVRYDALMEFNAEHLRPWGIRDDTEYPGAPTVPPEEIEDGSDPDVPNAPDAPVETPSPKPAVPEGEETPPAERPPEDPPLEVPTAPKPPTPQPSKPPADTPEKQQPSPAKEPSEPPSDVPQVPDTPPPDTPPAPAEPPKQENPAPALAPKEGAEEPPYAAPTSDDDPAPQLQTPTNDPSCFVATAAFADTEHPDVAALRRFRAKVLRKSRTGRAFIAVYWRVGPVLAHPVRRLPALARLSRWILSRLVAYLKAQDLC